MKSKFTTIIISFVILGIIGVIFIFAIILWQEMETMFTSTEPEQISTMGSFELTENKAGENISTPEVIENNIIGSIERTNSDEQIINYDRIAVDKYFYNQLDDNSKIIYRAFESNKENMKTGTYEINFGNTFSSLLNSENGQDLLGKYYQSAIEAYTYDNPEVFYLSPNKMYLNVETINRSNITVYNVYINNGNQSNYLIDEYTSQQEIDLAISKIESVKNEILQNLTGDNYQDIKMIHDYLVNNIEYDSTISKDNIYNIYGALVNKVAVCEGYARAFKYLLDYSNIPCTLGIGKGINSEGKSENHAWNYVQINSNWYAIDTTWDDPVIIGGGNLSQASKYRYFLKGSADFNKDHIPNGKFTADGKEFSYPQLSSSNY